MFYFHSIFSFDMFVVFTCYVSHGDFTILPDIFINTVDLFNSSYGSMIN